MPELRPSAAPPPTEPFDLLIVGAGIAGIGAAHHRRAQCPDQRFVALTVTDRRKALAS